MHEVVALTPARMTTAELRSALRQVARPSRAWVLLCLVPAFARYGRDALTYLGVAAFAAVLTAGLWWSLTRRQRLVSTRGSLEYRGAWRTRPVAESSDTLRFLRIITWDEEYFSVGVWAGDRGQVALAGTQWPIEAQERFARTIGAAVDAEGEPVGIPELRKRYPQAIPRRWDANFGVTLVGVGFIAVVLVLVIANHG